LNNNIHNLDETGFAIEVERSQTITTKDSRHSCYLASITNCNFVIVIECVLGDCQVIPSMVILTAKVHLEDQYMKTAIDGSYFLQMSKSGYINDVLTVK
jgi:hypothetical protein